MTEMFQYNPDDPNKWTIIVTEPEGSQLVANGVIFRTCHDCGASCNDILCDRCKKLVALVEENNELKLTLADLVRDVESYFTGTHTSLRDVINAMQQAKRKMRGDQLPQVGNMSNDEQTKP